MSISKEQLGRAAIFCAEHIESVDKMEDALRMLWQSMAEISEATTADENLHPIGDAILLSIIGANAEEAMGDRTKAIDQLRMTGIVFLKAIEPFDNPIFYAPNN